MTLPPPLYPWLPSPYQYPPQPWSNQPVNLPDIDILNISFEQCSQYSNTWRCSECLCFDAIAQTEFSGLSCTTEGLLQVVPGRHHPVVSERVAMTRMTKTRMLRYEYERLEITETMIDPMEQAIQIPALLVYYWCSSLSLVNYCRVGPSDLSIRWRIPSSSDQRLSLIVSFGLWIMLM